MGLYANSAPVDVIIATWPWGAYLGDESAGQRHPRQGLELAAKQPRRRDPARQGLGLLPQLDPRQDRVGQRRLRRGDPARRARLRLRGLGREHLRRPRGGDPDPAAHRLDPRRDQPQVGDPDRPRPRLHRGRARHRPRRALPRRGGLPDRHGGRDGAGAGDRRSRDRRPRRDHPPHAGEIHGRPARARRGVPRVARLRRRPGRRRGRDGARSAPRRSSRPTRRSGELPLPPSGRRGRPRAPRAPGPSGPTRSLRTRKAVLRWNR